MKATHALIHDIVHCRTRSNASGWFLTELRASITLRVIDCVYVAREKRKKLDSRYASSKFVPVVLECRLPVNFPTGLSNRLHSHRPPWRILRIDECNVSTDYRYSFSSIFHQVSDARTKRFNYRNIINIETTRKANDIYNTIIQYYNTTILLFLDNNVKYI